MTTTVLLDAAGRRRSPATVPGFLAGRRAIRGGNTRPILRVGKEILMVVRQAGHDRHGPRVRALIAVVWHAGLRISEALALAEADIDAAQGSVLVRRGKGDKRREAGMDLFGFQQLAAWEAHRVLVPPGPLFCVIDGQTRGRRWSTPPPATNCATSPSQPGYDGASHPTKLRHAYAVEMATRASRSWSCLYRERHDQHHRCRTTPGLLAAFDVL